MKKFFTPIVFLMGLIAALVSLPSRADVVNSVTSGKYYRIFSASSSLTDRMAMCGSDAGMMYGKYDEDKNGKDANFIFKVTSDGTFHGYDAYNIQSLANNMYMGKSSSQWTGTQFGEKTTTTSSYYVAMSITSWKECIIPINEYDGQFLIQPAFDTGSTLAQCASINGVDGTTGHVRINGWSDDSNAKGNSWRAWSFEEVDDATIQDIIDSQDPLKIALETYASDYANMVSSKDPGYYKKANVDEFKALYADYKAQSEEGGLSTSDKQNMATELNKAYAKAKSETNLITDGYYAIVSTYTKFNNKVALCITDAGLGWAEYDEESPAKFIFKVEDQKSTFSFDGQSHEQYTMQCLANDQYIGPGTSQMGATGTTSDTPWKVCVTYSSAKPQIVLQPMWTSLKAVSQCIAPSSTSGTSGTIRQSSWLNYSADGTETCWRFEVIDDKIVNDILNIVDSTDVIMQKAEADLKTITPADHHDNTGSRSFLLGNEKTSIDGLATSKEALAKLQAAYDAVKNGLDEGKKSLALTDEINALKEAMSIVEAKSNPLKDGYYHIIAEYGDDTNDIPGGYAITYGAGESVDDAVCKAAYDKTNAKQIFKVEIDSTDNSKVYLYNTYAGMYLGKLNSSNKWELTSEKTALNITSGDGYYWYWGADKTAAARSCSFVITDDSANSPKSSTTPGNPLSCVSDVTTSSQAWTIAWSFRPAEYIPTEVSEKWEMQPVTIKTPFADDVTPDSVWTEYPRPQMVRQNNWVNLNGIWSFHNLGSFDEELPTEGYREILVPFCVESALSGVKKHYENMVYRRKIDIPADWNGKRMLLHFGAVDWKCSVEVNGEVVGTHEGGYDPFTFDITDYVEAGKSANVNIRVYDPTDYASVPRGKQVTKTGGIFYTACSGIWQTVWMEAVNNSYISDFSITPDVDNSAVKIKAVAEGDASDLKATVYHNGTKVAEATGTIGEEMVINISNPDLWTPDHPFLYDVKLELLSAGDVTDEVATYFGMRKISIENKDGYLRTMLNNKFLFQMGPLDQGYWPESNLTPPSDAAIQNDIRMMKQMGFNMVRKHIKVEPARWYYWCDKMGLMVWQDMPSMNYGGVGGIGNDATIFTKELTAMVNNLKNVPSIVTWVVFNEAGGQHDTKKYVELVRSLDNTRLIDEASGWTHYGYGDIKDIHPYPAPSYTTSKNQATAVGEYGGVKFAIKDHLWKGSGWGYASVASAEEYDNTYTDYINSLCYYKSYKGLSAAVYTQLTDVEIEVNGIMTYDRIVKSDINKIFEANRHVIEDKGAEETYVVYPADINPETWKYTTTAPVEGWEQSGFNDSAWNTGKAGFGNSTSNAVISTTWNSSDIWLRKTVDMLITPEQVNSIMAQVYYDEDCEIYINGVLAYSATGYVSSYQKSALKDAAYEAINPTGYNVIAVHVKQTSGGQYFDLGLYLNGYRKTVEKTREIVVNMDYDKSSEVSFTIGYATDATAQEPEVVQDFDKIPLRVPTVGICDTLLQNPTELHFNITDLTTNLASGTPVKYFVYVNTTEGSGMGTAYTCKLVDYTLGENGEFSLMTDDKTLMSGTSVQLCDDELTAVDKVPTIVSEGTATIYDLYGRKVVNPQNGTIYIRQGKKFVK